MDFFRRLRVALALGEEISALRHELTQIRIEWSDVLDQLRAREERMRKRDRAKVRAAVQEDEEAPPPETAAFAGSGKAALRAHARQIGLL